MIEAIDPSGASSRVPLFLSATPQDIITAEATALTLLAERSPALHAFAQEAYLRRLLGIHGAIETGILPPEYRLPAPELFATDLLSLAPSYEAFDKEGWEPRVVFYPVGLSTRQWTGILSNHRLPTSFLSRGVHEHWEIKSQLTNPTRIGLQESKGWRVAVVSSLKEPAFRGVSRNGKGRSEVRGIIDALRRLPGMSMEWTPQTLISHASPSLAAYYTLQLTHLELGLSPVDSNGTRTMLRELTKVNDEIRALFSKWSPESLSLQSVLLRCSNAGLNGGIRPTAEGKNTVVNLLAA